MEKVRADDIWNELPKEVQDEITKIRKERDDKIRSMHHALKLDEKFINKDAINKEIEALMGLCIAYVVQAKCSGCEDCDGSCEFGAIVFAGGKAGINPSICQAHCIISCYPNPQCIADCPEDAIILLWI